MAFGIRQTQGSVVRAWNSWKEHIHRRKKIKYALAMASDHYVRTLLSKCLWVWCRETQLAAQQHQQEADMAAYRHMVHSLLKWQRLCRGLQQQQAIIERAVRLYQHRVLTAAKATAFKGWLQVTAMARQQRHSACVAYLQAYDHITLQRVFHSWLRMVAVSLRSALKDTRSELSATCNEVLSLQERLVSASAEHQVLVGQLDQASAMSADLQAQLSHKSDELAQVSGKLMDVERSCREAELKVQELSGELLEVTGERERLLQEQEQMLHQMQVSFKFASDPQGCGCFNAGLLALQFIDTADDGRLHTMMLSQLTTNIEDVYFRPQIPSERPLSQLPPFLHVHRRRRASSPGCRLRWRARAATWPWPSRP